MKKHRKGSKWRKFKKWIKKGNEFTPPEQLISFERAHTLHQEYVNNKYIPSNMALKEQYKNSGFNETRSVWFPLETLKEYVQYIEDISCSADVDISGIRFHLATYPNDMSSKYPGQLTFFMAPTMKIEDDKHKSFTVYHDGKGNLSTVLYHDIIQDTEDNGTTRINMDMMPGEELETALNEGSLLPPPFDSNGMD